MQNTRLTSLLSLSLARLDRWLENPWRRVSLVVISLLFGFFLATLVATTTGQTADIDALIALVLVVLVELGNWLIYRGRRRRSVPEAAPKSGSIQLGGSAPRRALSTELISALKLGLTYGLFLEAFKLGS